MASEPPRTHSLAEAATRTGPRDADGRPLPQAQGTWGPLTLLGEIGRGAFGRVYRAWDSTLGREVALKVLDLPGADPEQVAIVLREGPNLARVRHPNVVTVYWAQRIGDEFGLSMELIRGRTLADVVQQDGPLGPEEATVVGASLCRALAAVHSSGLVHRDLKANNAMRESGGRIVLMDFGTGRDLNELMRTSQVDAAGTPIYMAPEIFGGRPATVTSDIYSLGVLLFFLVTGKFPVDVRTVPELIVAHGLNRRRLLADCRPELPERFVRCVERALAVSPGDRYPSAGAMMRDLVEAAPSIVARGTSDVQATPRALDSTPVLQTPRRTSRSPHRSSRAVRQAQAQARRRELMALGAVLGIWVLGIFNSVAFNHSLGRSRTFSQESILDWWVYGFRSLIPPLLYAIPLVLVWQGIKALAGVATRRSTRVQSMVVHFGARAAAISTLLGLNDVENAGRLLVAAQVAALAFFVWVFRGLLVAFVTFLDDGPAEYLARLSPLEIDTHGQYGVFLTMLVSGMAVGAWLVFGRRGRATAETSGPIRIVSLSLIGVALVLLTVPWRFLWNNQFERVRFEDRRCYLLGETPEQALLYCPDSPPPRVREAPRDNARFERLGIKENIFTPADRGGGVPQ